MTPRTLVILVSSALAHPSAANELRDLALAAGVTDEAWENMASTLCAPMPLRTVILAANVARGLAAVAGSSLTDAPAEELLEYGEWSEVEPGGGSWRDGDVVMYRDLPREGAPDVRQFAVFQPPAPNIPGVYVLRYIRNA